MKEIIAVTGAAGFIGSNLVKMLLAQGYHVVAIDNLSAGTLANVPEGADFRQVDIRDKGLREHLRGASTVFHLAAKNCLADCAKAPTLTANINVMGTAHLLEECVREGIPHVVYADTSAEYEGVLEFPSTVDKVKPISVYACSKRGGALFCEAFTNLHPIKVTYVRYFNVYGPAQDWRRVIPPVMSAFTIKLLQGERPVIYGSGEKRRDFIHVDDINAFHLKLLTEPEIWGRTYNLGSGTDHSILEIFRIVQKELGIAIEPEFKADLPAEALRTLADISDAKQVGWVPKVSLEAGVRLFIDYTRERLALEPPTELSPVVQTTPESPLLNH